MKNSAMPERAKIVTLSQDIICRMRNIVRMEPIENRLSILNDLMTKIKYSGYPETSRCNILKNELRGYYGVV